MTCYLFLLEGQGFRLDSGGDPRPIGFYTTEAAQGVSLEEAKERLRSQIVARIRCSEMIVPANTFYWRPAIEICSIWLRDEADPLPAGGFTFYSMGIVQRAVFMLKSALGTKRWLTL